MNALSVFSFQENTPFGWFWLMANRGLWPTIFALL